MYAVWSNDQYPYYLVGKVEGEPDDDGYFRVPSYGGQRFFPFAVVSDTVGQRLRMLLDQLRAEENTAIDAVRKKGMLQISALIPTPPLGVKYLGPKMRGK